MPTVLCHACTKPTTLPDAWAKPSYECPFCGAVVSLSPSPLPPAFAEARRETTNVRHTFHWGNVVVLTVMGAVALFVLFFVAKIAGQPYRIPN